ncbi:hypothetical protein KL933_004597 [Ogataea haglerorum]|uniref:BAR domain-containing protein n=1 Tax=Ogataea haglerorum TaxID=1937702 RepID=A0AAN6D1V5_9ASCO|nr:hypothetical protein KL933_004597 [Ogataea haglerorum]KAG7727832.1 hypothetical protein KL948_004359 [Ogataea haglerorum]
MQCWASWRVSSVSRFQIPPDFIGPVQIRPNGLAEWWQTPAGAGSWGRPSLLDMSWLGFKKAVNRAGAHVILRTNKGEPSVDPEFDAQEANFRKLESYTNELDKELGRFVSNFENLLETQINMAKTLDSFYGDYSFDLKADKRAEAADPADEHKVNLRDGISLDYLQMVEDIKNNILPEILEPMSITVVEPIKELKKYNDEINKLIKKRARKKVDYDVSRFKFSKLQSEYEAAERQAAEQNHAEKTDQLQKSMDKLQKFKVEYDEAETIYMDINTRLKNEIEQFIALRLSLVDPTFESFIKIQLKLYSDIFARLEEKHQQLDAMTVQEHEEDKIDARLEEILSRMRALDIKNL